MPSEPQPNALDLGKRLVSFEPQGVVRWLSRASIASWVALFVFAFVASLFGTNRPEPQWIAPTLGLLAVGAMGCFVLAAIMQLLTWIAPKQSRETTVTQDAITMQGPLWTQSVVRSAIEAGWMQHGARGTSVVLRTKRGNKLSVDVSSEALAEQVLDTLGVHPDKRALEMPLGTATRSILGAIVSFLPASCAASIVAVNLEKLLHMQSASTGLLLFTLVPVFMIAIARARAAPVVEVGTDGVSVRTAFSKFFLPLSKIARATVGTHVIDVTLVDGTNHPIAALTDRDVLDVIAARINDGVARANASAPKDLSARLGSLDRDGRPFAAWLEQLRALAVARDDYRVSALTREELAQVLDDSLASPERRIAAAYVLAQMDQRAVTERVRVVVEKSANDAVSRALERAADGTLDEEVYVEATRENVRVG